MIIHHTKQPHLIFEICEDFVRLDSLLVWPAVDNVQDVTSWRNAHSSPAHVETQYNTDIKYLTNTVN